MENTKSNHTGKKNRFQNIEKSYTEKEIHSLDTQARAQYSNLIDLSRKIISGIDAPYIEIYEEAYSQTFNCIAMLKSNPFLLSYNKYSTADNYLYAHTANTALLSLAVGIALNLKEKELLILGISALLHDIGMTNFISLARKERKLNASEINSIKKHSFLGVKKLEKIIDFNYGDRERIEKIISQIHERYDGSGYPDGLKSDEIDILASIISVVDSYEAMTHIRSWRERIGFHLVVRQFIEEPPAGFDPVVLKKLIEVLSVFPHGSLIELSNGLIAQVLKINRNSILRPMVKIVLDENYNQTEEQILDLAQYPLTSIIDIVTIENLAKKNPVFAAELELSFLWIEW
ncbi:MAG: HD domain-containing protein [Elusimicrobia bacterium]|nr:HD domain-containing protein [Elusimicrobiota bacterium]